MPGNIETFLLIYIFYSMWYAEHFMNNEYRQTDGIDGRECWLREQCSHFFLALLKPSTHRQGEHKYTDCPSISFLYPYLYQLVSKSVCFFAQMTCISLNNNGNYYFYLFSSIELHSTLLFSNEFVCPNGSFEDFGNHLQRNEVIFHISLLFLMFCLAGDK